MAEPVTAGASTAPPVPHRRRRLGVVSAYAGLVRVLLAEYRTTWWFHAFFGFMLPLGLVYFVRVTADGPVSPERAVYLVGGNMATAIAYGPTMMLIGKLGWARQNREFDYWAALPVGKLTLILAMMTVYLLFSLPGLAGVYLMGSLLLGLPLGGGWALLPLVPLGALSLTGLGAFLGAYARDGQSANVLGNFLIGFVTFLSPLMLPAEAMPAPLRVVARFVPTTYAADGFRAALSGAPGGRLLLDAAVLALFAAGFLLLVHRKLDWRAA